jgi:serine/threonine protein kinase
MLLLQAGIVHRDLKPENIFTEKGPDTMRQLLIGGITPLDAETAQRPMSG